MHFPGFLIANAIVGFAILVVVIMVVFTILSLPFFWSIVAYFRNGVILFVGLSAFNKIADRVMGCILEQGKYVRFYWLH